jgi:hypothetical protein
MSECVCERMCLCERAASHTSVSFVNTSVGEQAEYSMSSSPRGIAYDARTARLLVTDAQVPARC